MGKRILVVDDDRAIAESLKYFLEDTGYIVETYGDGSFVKSRYMEEKPDLILLDYWLPQENGGEITKKLKSEKSTKKIPIVIISASYNIKDAVMAAGADDFLEKPYDMDQMLRVVKKHLVN